MNKSLALLLLLLLFLPAPAELLKLERLQKPRPRFTLKQDIFHGGADDDAATLPAAAPTPVQAEVLQRTIAEEIAQSVSYEGFILKGSKPMALLNVSGEFFTVGEKEMILDKIRILKIAKEMVTIEYDGQPYEIRSKGDQ